MYAIVAILALLSAAPLFLPDHASLSPPALDCPPGAYRSTTGCLPYGDDAGYGNNVVPASAEACTENPYSLDKHCAPASSTTDALKVPDSHSSPDCPRGTYRSGDQCMPYRSFTPAPPPITPDPARGCPNGYYSAGGQCAPYPGTQNANPAGTAGGCPGGWYRSGMGCRRYSGD